MELRLEPKELGRVRMTLAVHDGAVTIQVAADRHDTLGLLRRHADQLATGLRESGFGDVSFSFRQDSRPAPQPPLPPPDEPEAQAAPASISVPPPAPALAKAKLDIRV